MTRARVVASTLDVELVKVGELLPGESELLIRAGVGWRAGVVGSETEPADSDSAAGYSLRCADAVVSDDLAAERRFNIPGLVHEHGARSAAAVVIGGRRAPFGVLGVLSRNPRRFSDDDVNFLQAVAHVLATAVERSRIERRVRDAREAERRRIARDLHDEALRDLSLALTEARRAPPAGQLVPALKRVGDRLRSAIYDLRLAAEQPPSAGRAAEGARPAASCDRRGGSRGGAGRARRGARRVGRSPRNGACADRRRGVD